MFVLSHASMIFLPCRASLCVQRIANSCRLQNRPFAIAAALRKYLLTSFTLFYRVLYQDVWRVKTMRNALPQFASSARWKALTMCAALLVSLVATAAAQAPSDNANAQREAMKKLAFLAGQWSGPITISRGPGEPLKLTQTENIQFKLGGLVLLIEGTSTGADGKAQFEALTTVAFDNASQTYRFRAYHDGNYLDAPLTVLANLFSWEYSMGPAKVVNTMKLTDKGEWQETTNVTVGSNPPRPSAEMLLTHKP
jgi:hypothetical protein